MAARMASSRRRSPDHENDQRRARFVAHAAVAVTALSQRKARIAEALDVARVARMEGLGLLLHQRGVRAVQRGRGLLPRYAGLEPRQQVNPVIVVPVRAVPIGGEQRLEAHWYVDIDIAAERGAVEVLGRDADHGKGVGVHADGLVQHVQLSAELVAPIAVAQHRHGASAARPVVFGRNHAADERFDAKHGEIAARYHHGRPAHGLLSEGQVGAEIPEARHSGYALRWLLQLAEHRVTENVIAVAGIVVGTAAALEVVRRFQQDELLGMPHRKIREYHLVQQREDRRIGPDTQSQR